MFGIWFPDWTFRQIFCFKEFTYHIFFLQHICYIKCYGLFLTNSLFIRIPIQRQKGYSLDMLIWKSDDNKTNDKLVELA